MASLFSALLGIGNGKTTSDVSMEQIVQFVRQFIGNELRERMEWERKAYVNVMYKQGNFWVNDEGRPDDRDPNLLRRPVPKFRSTLRALKNAVTYNDPIIEPIPNNGEDVDQTELDVASIICRNEFKMAGNGGGMRQLIKALVDDAALKSWGFLSVLPEEDPKAKNRINCISIHDPFDVFFDNQDMEKARVVVISSLEDKQFLISQGYDEAKVVLSSEGTSVSHSILKSTFELNQGTDQNDKKLGKLLVDHVYYIDDGQKGKPTVKYFVISGGTLLKEEETLKGYRSLSQIFFPYYLEYDPHVKYPTPWMTDAVALQRSLNDASENADTIAHWTAKVRFMQRAGSSNTLQLIGDRHVQKIRYSGDKPQFMEMPAVPPSLFNLIGVREAQIEDAVGMHSASMGRIEGDRQSGRLTALAQAGDMDNVSEPVSNLEVFLAKVFAQILENAADNTREAMEIYGDNQEKFMVISEDLIGEATEGAVAIKRFKNVKVTVVPGNMQQLAQGRQEILNLFPVLAGENFEEERKALFKVLMRMYAVGTSRDIAKALEREQEEEERRNADVKIAELEVEKMAQGMPVTATPEQPHEIHVQLKTLALKNIVGQVGKDSDVFQIFMNNIMQHQSFLEGTKPTTIADAFSGGAV